MGQLRTAKKPISDINVVPYIDVMLVLLIVFMVTAPLLSQGIKVNLPDTESAVTLNADETPVVVSLSEKGAFYLNVGESENEPLTLDALTQALSKIRQARPKVPIFLEADESVAYGQVMFLLSALQAAKITRVSLVTEPLIDSP